MAEEMWKARFRERVLEAAGRLERVCELLGSVMPHLTSPMLAGDAVAVHARIQPALDTLRDASGDIASVMSFIGAVEILALRGGSTNPTVPLPVISQLSDRHLAERNALTKLCDAAKGAQEAYSIVDLCVSHLLAIAFLLDYPGLPGVDGLIEAERLAALGDLAAAIGNVGWCASDTTLVRRDGIN